MSLPQLQALTGLRGMAAVWVFVYHWNLFYYGTGMGYHVLAVGYAGVDVFFLLSGFIMAHSRYDQFKTHSLGEYGVFLLERCVRLYPTNAAAVFLYASVVTATPAIMLVDHGANFAPGALLSSFALTNSWPVVGHGGWIAPAWSVSLEILAYLALPLLLVSVRLMSARWAAVAAVTFMLLFAASVVVHGDHDPNVKNRGALVRLACEFTAGVAMCRFWREGGRIKVASGSIIALLMLGAALSIPIPEAMFLIVPAAGLVILLSAQGDGPISHMLSGSVPCFLGRISYSLYLVHWPALIVFQYYGGLQAGPIAGLGFAAAVITIATGVHYAVEAPSHRLARMTSARAWAVRQKT